MKKVLFISFLFVLCNCVSNNGAKFTELIEPKKDEAVVYFYRPSKAASMVYYKIKDEDDNKISTMYVKSYYPYITKELGARTFTGETESKKSISLDVQGGQTYFVKAGVKMGVLVGRPKFELVDDKEKALKDLKKCSISND